MGSLVDRLSPLAGHKVLVTGMSGFKGTWLSLWLRELGAEVIGLSLEPETSPSLFEVTGLNDFCQHIILDIRRRDQIVDCVRKVSPSVVFHLAAQPLVLRSYDEPLETFDVNITGSLNVLEAIRQSSSVRALVYVTSDKCYRNDESGRRYSEEDALGGLDPYSASKAAADLLFTSYCASFFADRDEFGAVSVRSGNVVGGGDWSTDRLLPDCVRALKSNLPIILRNPDSVRPWQHVLDPLAGYLMLAADLVCGSSSRRGAWNFGPDAASFRTVEEVARLAIHRWGAGEIVIEQNSNAGHEARLLMLNSSKARAELGWTPQLDFESAVTSSVNWYRKFQSGADAFDLIRSEIAGYMRGFK